MSRNSIYYNIQEFFLEKRVNFEILSFDFKGFYRHFHRRNHTIKEKTHFTLLLVTFRSPRDDYLLHN